ncbi:lipid IV(A) 3-deoxy-D-manno-octulosonic acid transferase [Idiomarina sp. OT37-5b]|uniref:lipid IV(A) 3-deoxy-D-manno-octulosonic acid transferase n=1 Tax=Idiomarina sp. OT37-5b TaxID=2100422 RepID=UPI0021CAFB0A|nr:lipid IV(A) 3-deoxy-D-manno-octulosonic acid transferase [Idiomarina sp. OT37-5b]
MVPQGITDALDCRVLALIMLRRLYAALMTALVPLLVLYFWLRGRKDPGYRQHLGERLAFTATKAEYQGGLLIHSVSVGETLAAKGLIAQLLAEYPMLPITVTCMTPTARRLIEARFGDRVNCVYFPLDYPGAVKRFIERLAPQAVWLMETELWPRFLDELKRRRIPVALLNARLSQPSAAGYRRLQALLRPVWQQLALVSAQTQASARRFRALGAPAVTVDGNLKFDVTVTDEQRCQARTFFTAVADKPVWLCASTHPGEHEIILDAYAKIKRAYDVQLVIAPRHPEQFERVAELLNAAGVDFTRRSEITEMPNDDSVLIADSMGEMLVWSCAADISFVGGSLIERGGHNPLELIAGGSAVLSGRSVYNFAEIYQQLNRAKGVRWVDDCDTLVDQVAELLSDSNTRQQQIAAAQKVLLQHKGATQRVRERALQATFTGNFMVKTQTNGKEFIKFDSAVLPECEAKHFSPKYWQQQKAIAGNSTGRATVWFIQQGDHGMLLRHYYRGGLVGKVNKDRFWREPEQQSRAIHEFDLLGKLVELGLPVPKPIAARMIKTGLFSYRADILVEVIPGAIDVFRLLRDKPLTAEQWQTLGAAVKQMHNHNVYHSDLNCHNLMLDDQDKAWIVDFDKCGFKEPDQWKQDNLARLKRSLVKEKGKNESFFWKENRDWPEFLTGYEKS